MGEGSKEKLLEGIAYFEQIRQMMPEDRDTLEFLCIAYEQVGEQEKYLQRVTTLAHVLVRERDFESAQKLIENLEHHADSKAKAAALKLRALLTPTAKSGSAPAMPFGSASRVPAREDAKSQALAAELKLIEWLEKNEVVDRELLATCGEQLRALVSAKGDFLVSALAVLNGENPAAAEAASAVIADETKTPPIALESFEQVTTLAQELPERFVRVHGAVPFGRIADEMLVALANPMDADLRRTVSAMFGGKCHFFMAPPLSLASVLNRLYPETNK